MLDPVQNAKSLAVLFAIGVAFNLLSFLAILSSGESILILLALLMTVLTCAVAIGLYRTKRWAIYALGGLVLVDILATGYSLLSDQQPTPLEVVMTILLLGCFFWFYSARDRFS